MSSSGASIDLTEELRAKGYRLTPARQLVLGAVLALEHATPDAICAEVQRTASSVNLSTVYRTLELLEELSLVSHTHLGPWRADLPRRARAGPSAPRLRRLRKDHRGRRQLRRLAGRGAAHPVRLRDGRRPLRPVRPLRGLRGLRRDGECRPARIHREQLGRLIRLNEPCDPPCSTCPEPFRPKPPTRAWPRTTAIRTWNSAPSRRAAASSTSPSAACSGSAARTGSRCCTP